MKQMVEIMDRVYDIAVGLERSNDVCTNKKVAEDIFDALAGEKKDDDP